MNILVTGANGQLGNEIRIIARDASDNYIFTDVVGNDIVALDITNCQAVDAMVDKYNIDCIVNCAAYTNVDRAEDDYDMAQKLNCDAVRNLAIAMKRVGGLLIHVSTDYVFGGNTGNTPRAEDEPANPTGVYGLTKLHGEEAVLQTGVRYVILRTAWLYSEFGKNFVKTMLQLTATRPLLNVVFDQVGSPTYALDLAKAICDIISRYAQEPANRDNFPYGIYHYSNEGVCSWYDFTKMIQEFAYNRSDSPLYGKPGLLCDIQPCHSSEFPSRVVRPSYSVLDKTKFKQTFGKKIPYWTDSLKACLDNMS